MFGWVSADPSALQQVLSQLLDNAVKFSRPHGTVRLGSRVVGREVVLTVEDSGPGIDRERERRLFEPFEGDTVSEPAGIGLAIVQGIVTAHGGEVDVRNVSGGCRFEVLLPAAGVASS